MWRTSRATASAKGKARPAPEQSPSWSTEQFRVLPVTIEWDMVLIDTPMLSAYAGGLRVFPSGFEVRITAMLRPDGPGAEDPYLQERVRLRAVGNPREQVTSAELAARFRIGVRFADGRGALVDPRFPPHRPSPGDALPLATFGAGGWSRGGPTRSTVSVYGLPGQGPVTLFYQWLEFGVPESSVEIDGDELRAAAARAIVLWEHC